MRLFSYALPDNPVEVRGLEPSIRPGSTKFTQFTMVYGAGAGSVDEFCKLVEVGPIPTRSTNAAIV